MWFAFEENKRLVRSEDYSLLGIDTMYLALRLNGVTSQNIAIFSSCEDLSCILHRDANCKETGGLKSSLVWEITPRSPPKVNRRFGRTCCPHLQGRISSQARNQHEAGSKQSRGTRRSLKAWNLLWFCYCFITSRQWLSLFRCLVLRLL
jgi:hypothetical protein